MQLALIIGGVLVLVLAGMLIRVQNLVDTLKGSHNKRQSVSNDVNAFLFLVFLVVGLGLFAWITVHSRMYYLPDSASVHGHKTDYMFWETMVIITFVFVITHFLLLSFPWIYRFRENRQATFFPDNHKLELVWTVIPAIVLTILVLGGFRVWSEVTAKAPAESVKLEIVGKQFNWIIRYPGRDGVMGKYNFRKIDDVNSLGIDFTDKAAFDDFMPDKIYIPVNRPVEFTIRSRDVLHSVFAMHFRQKMDAVPGMPTSFWFTPELTTSEMRSKLNNPDFNYEIACTEVCGRNHYAMRMQIVVLDEKEYNEWYAKQCEGSFLNKNPQYISDVPEELKPLAMKQLPAPATAETPAPAEQTAGI